MKLVSSFAVAAAAAALLAAAPAFAAQTLIDFEGVGSFGTVGEFYNGGVDSVGNTGANLGVSFTDAAFALSNDGLGGGTNGDYFSHAPSGGSVMFATDASALMNVAKGFTGEISFYYSAASAAADVVTIYSGLNGSGSVLGTVSLTANAQIDGCSDSAYCNWQRLSLSFDGTGQSISFGGNPGGVAFDNVTISAVPEPQSAALLAMGLAGVMLLARRSRKD